MLHSLREIFKSIKQYYTAKYLAHTGSGTQKYYSVHGHLTEFNGQQVNQLKARV